MKPPRSFILAAPAPRRAMQLSYSRCRPIRHISPSSTAHDTGMAACRAARTCHDMARRACFRRARRARGVEPQMIRFARRAFDGLMRWPLAALLKWFHAVFKGPDANIGEVLARQSHYLEFLSFGRRFHAISRSPKLSLSGLPKRAKITIDIFRQYAAYFHRKRPRISFRVGSAHVNMQSMSSMLASGRQP